MTEEEMNNLVIFDASKEFRDDNNEQVDAERDLSEPVRNVLDKESELD